MVQSVRTLDNRQADCPGSVAKYHTGINLRHGYHGDPYRRSANLLLDFTLRTSHIAKRLRLHVFLGIDNRSGILYW